MILLLNRMSNAQSSESVISELDTTRTLIAGGPAIHMTAQALRPPTSTTEISPPPPTNMPHLPFLPLQSVQKAKPPLMSSLQRALGNHSKNVDPSNKGPSVKGPLVGKPSEKGPSVNGPAATISDQTVLLNTEGLIVGDTTHLFSGVPSAVDSFHFHTTEVSPCTAANGEKVIVVGSSTLLAGGKTTKISDQATRWEPKE